MTPIDRAERAKQLLEDQVFKDAFAAVREQLVSALESAPFGDQQTHHHITLQLQALRQIPILLRKWADVIALDKAKHAEEKFVEAEKRRVLNYINPA